ncbi:uncharacterized protein PG998_006467, partial [Apiospora kogelbergensis]|uniref:uncharacterized protein n=1 Tax=Apiospora kogelbergensis TaxID=1337665 RepID=UPI0031300812
MLRDASLRQVRAAVPRMCLRCKLRARSAPYAPSEPVSMTPFPSVLRASPLSAQVPEPTTITSRLGEGSPSLARAQTATTGPDTSFGESPEEVEAAEAERQDFDPTSGLAFFQRAHQRLVAQQSQTSMSHPRPLSGNSEQTAQLLTWAGDRPLVATASVEHNVPGGGDLMQPDLPSLVEFYFETCVVTYRMFAQQRSVMAWAQAAQQNKQQGLAVAHGIGNAKAAIVLAIAAIAALKSGRAQLHSAAASSRTTVWDERPSLQEADRYYAMAASLTESEVGPPCLESTQARLVQVLYLLQTSRMNKAWYLLGATWQIGAALELHRKQSCRRGSYPPDYVTLQGHRRTFWVTYTIDAYLSVVLGRPRHIHDDDVDQELPAAIDDEDVGPKGPTIDVDRDEEGDEATDSNMESVVAHARLARIIGAISSEVYSIKNVPREERLAAASRSRQELCSWRSCLPPHLSSVSPRSLIPSLRRQAIAMRLAYCHAVMHANRPFILGGGGGSSSGNYQNSSDTATAASALEEESVAECIASAKTALKTVQSMAADSTLLHAFWWTPYVTFCALAVCHARLARSTSADSPSWRYTVILDELRHSARAELQQQQQQQHMVHPVTAINHPGSLSSDRLPSHAAGPQPVYNQSQLPLPSTAYAYTDEVAGSSNVCDMPLPFFQGWQTTDWRDLDAS